jgi:hypothetical protein
MSRGSFGGSIKKKYKVKNSVMESQGEYLDDVKSLAELTHKGSHVYGPRGLASRVPCRRSCSTIHNPMFHRGRFDTIKEKKKKKRASSAEGNKKKDFSKFDWGFTDMSALVDVARINKSIALQRVNADSIDVMTNKSMDEPASANIRFGKDDDKDKKGKSKKNKLGDKVEEDDDDDDSESEKNNGKRTRKPKLTQGQQRLAA